MNHIGTAIGRAIISQLHPKMLGLAILPFVGTLTIWLALGIWFWSDVVRFVNATVFKWTGVSGIEAWAASLVADWGFTWIVHAVVAVAGWLVMLPLIFVVTMILLAVFGTPIMAKHVARDYADLEMRHGGDYPGSIVNSAVSLAVFLASWVLILPLCFFLSPLAPILFLLPWAYLNARLFRYDALFQHADADEIKHLSREHWWGFVALGTIAAFLTFIPLIGLMLFVFIGLFFVHYALLVLAEHRARSASAAASTNSPAALTAPTP